MGDNADNYEPNPDYQFPGGVKTLVAIKPRAHRGSEQIDSQAPAPATGQALVDIRGAPTLAAFNVAMTARWPNWWPPLASRWGAGMYAVIQGL